MNKRRGHRVTIKWYARGGGILRCGPFDTQVEATKAIRQVQETDEEYRRAMQSLAVREMVADVMPTRFGNLPRGAYRDQYKGGFPSDAFVWPEES